MCIIIPQFYVLDTYNKIFIKSTTIESCMIFCLKTILDTFVSFLRQDISGIERVCRLLGNSYSLVCFPYVCQWNYLSLSFLFKTFDMAFIISWNCLIWQSLKFDISNFTIFFPCNILGKRNNFLKKNTMLLWHLPCHGLSW